MNNKIANALLVAAMLWRGGQFARAGDWLRYAEALASIKPTLTYSTYVGVSQYFED